MSGVAVAIAGSTIIGAGASYLAADEQSDAMRDAARISSEAGRLAAGQATGLYDIARGDYLQNSDQALGVLQSPSASQGLFQPYADAGINALQQQAMMAGQDPFANFEESEAQKFYRDRQEQSLLRNSAAIGGLGGGNVRTALQEQAVGIAGQQRDQYGMEQQQRFNNLGFLTNTGFQANSNMANMSQQDRINLANAYERRGQNLSGFGTGLGITLANIATGQGTDQANYAAQSGEARAAGILGIGNTATNALNSAAMYQGYNSGQSNGYNPGARDAGVNAQTNQNLAYQNPGTIWQ